MSRVRCPVCFNRHLQVVVRQLADVVYDEDGDHEVREVYGDVDFDDDSHVICATNHGGCGHAGTLKEFSA